VSDAITVVEGLDLVVSLAAGQVHPEDLDAARNVAETARARAGHLGTTMVLALIGGTGSGKSSLLNALAGEEVASTSPLRPHTTEPLAWVPSRSAPSLSLLLDRLGIDRRITHSRFEELAILDMTDIDSIAVGHRELVERLLPEVDLVVWVLDPVKYADPVLHRDFIFPLANSSDRLIFVLNKIDRLDEPNLNRLTEHLGRLLEDDGIDDPLIFEVAADPLSGQSRGIDELAAHLRARLDEKRVHVGKIIDDARRVSRAVADAAGVTAGSSLDFEERWLSVREAIISDVSEGGGPGAFEEGLRLIEGFILKVSTDAGGVFGSRLRNAFEPDLIEKELSAALEEAAVGGDSGRELDRQLQERFGVPLRKLLWERASLAAVVAGLAVDATMVAEGIGRPSR
jgi:ribosome biogenesis GTPase A